MFCPSCQNTLRERERDGVMLDICPGCGGVWLDRGELEKLTTSERNYYRRDDDDDDDDDDRPRVDRYEARPAYEGARGGLGYDDRRPRENDDRRYEDDRTRGGYGQPRKKRGFLENILGNFGEGGADD